MKIQKTIAVSLLLLLSGLACAQKVPFMIKDSFDDTRYNWWQGDQGNAGEHIRNGKLNIVFPENGWYLSITPYIVFEKDFVMQATFRQLTGQDNHGLGLMWGYSSDDRNYFLVTANGYFYIYHGMSENQKLQGVKEWVKTDYAKPIGSENILKVEQSSGKLSFYINGNLVSTQPSFRWSGNKIGVVSFHQMNVEVDDFSFIQQGVYINLPTTQGKSFVKENLGPNINTAADDLAPQISVDGKTLYFGRENYEGNLGGKDDGEDIYYSKFEGDQWGPAMNMGSPINTTGVNNLLAVSADNNSMLFATATNFFIRKRTESGWSEKEDINVNFTNEGDNFESCLSADGKAILFTARNSNNLFYKKGDVLERDIFVSLQDANGKWGVPFNLGPELNTSGDELGPFLAADGRTLYFSTNGRPGYGNEDIFVSKRLGDGWTHWSEPVNLGPEINTTGFDGYYVLPASGDNAYMVSSINGYGKTDIIRMKLPPPPVIKKPVEIAQSGEIQPTEVKQTVPIANETRPDPVMLIRGKTLDAKTKNPISADIHIDNLSTSKEVGEAISDPATGDFRFVLPFGTNYGFHASSPGHLSVNENLELAAVSNYSEVEKNLYLVPIEVGANIQLNNVFFEQGRPILKPESYPELDRLVTIMKENPTLEIELHGYTDNNGRETALIILSMDRVNAVKRYMMDKGVNGKRIAGKGLGPANPVVKNDTEEHRRMNRRVEFKVVKK